MTHRRVTDEDRAIAELLLDLFRPRMDVYATRIDEQADADALTTWYREHDQPSRVARVGDWSPAGGKGRRKPLTVDAIARHVAGLVTLGVYPLRPDATCASVSVDFDNHRGGRILPVDPRTDYEALSFTMLRRGVRHLGNVSRGGRGYWIHVLPPDGTTAADARAVLHGLLAEAGVRHVDAGGTFDCLFPKQDEPAATRPGPDGTTDATANPGNLFCLPCNRRWMEADTPGTHFVGTAPVLAQQLAYLEDT